MAADRLELADGTLLKDMADHSIGAPAPGSAQFAPGGPGPLSQRLDAILRPYRLILIAAAVLAGIAERVLWNALRPAVGAAGEAPNVAIALAEGRGFADAYRLGQGPTAHVLPISPGIAGGVYTVFGVRTPLSEFILACWSIGLAMGTYLLLFRAFSRLGTPLWARLAALGFACVAPIYTGQEAVDFRIWEGGLAVFLTTLFLDRLLAMDGTNMPVRLVAAMAAMTAALFFVNPALGLGAYACAGIFSLQYLRLPRLFGAAAIAALALAVFLVPWTMRNAAAFGEPILLRSNAGLELALANHPGALDRSNPRETYMNRLNKIHPAPSPNAYRAMQAAGGEAAYARELGNRAKAWMTSHPSAVAMLAFRHLRQSMAPEEWQFRLTPNSPLPQLRAALSTAVGALGAAGLMLAVARRRPGWAYPALLLGTPIVALCLFQPVPRYTYLFYPMLVFCAWDFIATVLARIDTSQQLKASG